MSCFDCQTFLLDNSYRRSVSCGWLCVEENYAPFVVLFAGSVYKDSLQKWSEMWNMTQFVENFVTLTWFVEECFQS